MYIVLLKLMFQRRPHKLTKSSLYTDVPTKFWKTQAHLESLLHSGIYGHKNETQILEIVAFIVQFYTHFNTYDMN